MIFALLAVLSMQETDAAAAGAASAAVHAPADTDEVVDCANAVTTYEMNVCAGRDLEREKARMHQYLAAAQTRAAGMDADSLSYQEPTHLAVFLQTSQTAWEAYSTIACDGVYDQWKGGTIRTIMLLGCKIELTRERTHFIWQNYLTYMDSTPPVLPEPVDQTTEAPTTRE